MRKNFMKKAVAVTLSAAMTFSLSAVTNPTTASAATVGLNKVTKTMKVGKKYTIKLNKAGQKKWKITKATSKKPKVVKVKNTTKKNVVVKSLKKGTSTVTLTLKKKNGKAGTKTLKCKIYVKDETTPTTTPTEPSTTPTEPSTTPTEPSTPAIQREATAHNQEELNELLNNNDLEVLTLETDATEIKIPAVDRSGLKLIVDAKNAEIENEALFGEIEIKAIGEDTWVEKSAYSNGNKLTVTAKTVHIIVDLMSKLRSLTLKQEGLTSEKTAKIEAKGAIENVVVDESTELTLDVQGEGSVDNVNVKAADSSVAITGGETAKAVNVTVAATATGAILSSSVKVAVTLEVVATIELKEGAAGSSVQVSKDLEDKEITVKNSTGEKVELTSADGKNSVTIENGNTEPVKAPASDPEPTEPTSPTTPTNPTNPTTPDYSGGDSGDADEDTYDGEVPTVNVDNVSISNNESTRVTDASTVTGGATVTSGASVIYKVQCKMGKFTLPSTVSGCTMSYEASISGLGDITKVSGSVDMTGNEGTIQIDNAVLSSKLDADNESLAEAEITIYVKVWVCSVNGESVSDSDKVVSTVERSFTVINWTHPLTQQ